MGLRLLAIGGPSHGETLPYKEGQSRIDVPLLPKHVIAADYADGPRWCLHPGHIISLYDGDRHWIGANKLAELYGLRPREWRAFDKFAGHRPDQSVKWCLFPDETGTYSRMQREYWDPFVPTIHSATYEVRKVSDRLVWAYVG